VAALAAEHGVSQRWLRLVAFGTLDDPAFVRAIRKAATVPALWSLVAPTAREALAVPTMKIERLGGSRDDLLASLLQSLEVLRHPINQNFAKHTSAIEHVDQSLDVYLQSRRDVETDYGRRNIASIDNARKVKAAASAAGAPEWKKEVDARKPGITKASVHLRIANREKTTPGAIAQAIKRLPK
jgi:hypothetical protein